MDPEARPEPFAPFAPGTTTRVRILDGPADGHVYELRRGDDGTTTLILCNEQRVIDVSGTLREGPAWREQVDRILAELCERVTELEEPSPEG